jgi:hypothetical protein
MSQAFAKRCLLPPLLLGLSSWSRLLAVMFTESEPDLLHLFSARPATKTRTPEL